MARSLATSLGSKQEPPAAPKLSGLLAPYRGQILLLIMLTVASSALMLLVPQVAAHAIDTFAAGQFDMSSTLIWLSALAGGAFVLGGLQVAVQTYGVRAGGAGPADAARRPDRGAGPRLHPGGDAGARC